MLRHRMAIVNEQYIRNSVINDLVELDKLLDAVSKEKKVKFFSSLNALCVKDKCQVTTGFNGKWTLTAWDYAHLTEGGSVLLAKKLFETTVGRGPQ